MDHPCPTVYAHSYTLPLFSADLSAALWGGWNCCQNLGHLGACAAEIKIITVKFLNLVTQSITYKMLSINLAK